ncbi:hypothetical protein CH361_10810 [Leptospira brenneri]|nr:hypothetical protein CH361_10810 [Leptospira brenneri]
MMTEIKLLFASLLNDEEKIKEITHWLRVMDRPNGWHYDLDHVWILKELEKAGILPGSTILDAGAGQGIMQYLLASRGYNVISLDFSPRTPPPRSKGIFKIYGEGNVEISYHHPYMKFINFNSKQSEKLLNHLKWKKFKKLPELPGRIIRKINSYIQYLFERLFKNHMKYGTIRYLRAPFHDVPIESGSVDAVISVSAIEHSDIELFNDNIKSLSRLIKQGGLMLLTTSATEDKDNHYDEKVSGWCFSIDSLVSYFPGSTVDFDSKACSDSLLGSNVFMKRLDPYYYLDPNSPFYRKKFQKLPYLPVGIKLVK